MTPGPGASPPGPAGRRLVGNLQDYEQDRLGFLLAARDEYGDIVAFDRRTTIVNGARLARELLQDRRRELTLREDFLQRRMTPDALEEAVLVRRLLNPGLRRTTVAAAAPDVARIVDDVFGPVGAAPVDPVPLLEEVTSRSVARYYFGDDGAALPGPLGRLLDALAAVIGNPFALPPNRWSPARRRIARRHCDVLEVVLPLLHRRAARPTAYDDLATQLAVAPARDVTLERRARLVVASMLAAHRVPAAAAGWMLMLVAHHPEATPGLATEAARRAGSRLAGEAFSCADFPMAAAVVAETLRLYPATWLITRTAQSEVELGGYRFAAGHTFLVSPYVVHRDEREFPDAGTFRPTRWLGEARGSPAYLAFGHGRHACPGSHLATMTLATIVLTLSAGRRWTCGPGEVRPDPRTTLLPRGLTLVFSP